MVRVGNLWSTFCSISTAEEAIIRGTENKRGDRVVKRVLGYIDNSAAHAGKLNPDKVRRYASNLIAELESGRWHHAKGRTRTIQSSGKVRNIEISRLRDHIVQWMVVLTMEDYWMKRMYRYSCGNLPGRGIKAVRKNVERWTRSKDCSYFVKLDIHHFYQSVDLNKLLALLQRQIKDKRFLTVMREIVFSAQQQRDDGTTRNLAIGYFSSPWLANVYLMGLDQFITEKLYKERRGKRVKWVTHYIRYVDDMLLMGSSKSDLKKSVKRIMEFCRSKLGLEIKPNWEICKIGELLPPDSNGKMKLKPGTKCIDIAGYTFTTTTTGVRAHNFLRAKRLIRRMAKRLKRTGVVLLANATALVSRLGWFSHSNSVNFYRKYVDPYIDITFIKGVISYAAKNGIVGKSARIYCRKGGADGKYYILHGCCRCPA
jgi:retron-type reverse transcriptase